MSEDVYIYRLTDGTATAEIMEYGAAIVSLYPIGGKEFNNKEIGLAAQTEPNCINHGEGIIYNKGETYTQLTVYEFIEK